MSNLPTTPNPGPFDPTNLSSIMAWVVDRGFAVAVAVYLLTQFQQKMQTLSDAVTTNTYTLANVVTECGKTLGGR